MTDAGPYKKMLIDRLKPGAEHSEVAVSPNLEVVHVIEASVEMLKEEGVECVFSLTAGGIWQHEAFMQKAGIKRVNMRHEQAATFAADAWGRVTGRPGVALIGPSTGLTNAASGVTQSMAAQSPMLVLCTTHPMALDDSYTAQGIVNPEHLFNGITKWTRRVGNGAAMLFELKRAMRSAVTPPSGPVCIATPGEVYRVAARQARAFFYHQYTPGYWAPRPREPREDPALIEKAMRWLLEAERPAMIVGEGIHYQNAVPELNEFVNLLGIPCHCRRASRGAISEYSPLNCYGRARGRIMRNSDRALVMGLRIGFLEHHGLPPFWGPQTKYIQAQTCQENVNFVLATEHELIGNTRALLRQMIDCLRDMGIGGPPQKWSGWRNKVAETKEWYEEKAFERTATMQGKKPLHPDLAGKLMAEFIRDDLKDDCISVIDGFTASSYFTDWLKVKQSANVMDASETLGIGHAPGMAIGASMATGRKKPVFALMGDGAIGVGGMDIETASRWNIPAVFCVENNSAMITGGWPLFFSKIMRATGNPLQDSWQMLPDIRYDKMFAEFGCHAEFVRTDAEIKPAMKRAFDFATREQRPAIINVLVDPEVMHETWANSMVPTCVGAIHWDDLPEAGQKMIIEDDMVPRELMALVDPSWHPHITGKAKGPQR